MGQIAHIWDKSMGCGTSPLEGDRQMNNVVKENFKESRYTVINALIPVYH